MLEASQVSCTQPYNAPEHPTTSCPLSATPVFLKVKAKVFTKAHDALYHLAQYCLIPSFPLPSADSLSFSNLGLLICLKPVKYTPAPGPLRWLFIHLECSSPRYSMALSLDSFKS